MLQQPQRIEGSLGCDLAGRAIMFESLRNRSGGVYRAAPVPPELLDTLDLVDSIREAPRRGPLIWPWRRMTGFRSVKGVIAAADIQDGPYACPNLILSRKC